MQYPSSCLHDAVTLICMSAISFFIERISSLFEHLKDLVRMVAEIFRSPGSRRTHSARANIAGSCVMGELGAFNSLKDSDPFLLFTPNNPRDLPF